MDKFTEIESFIKVAESGSFSQAASRLRVGKSTISRRVSDLEARLGAQLFHRTTRNLSLTDVGETFLKRCQRLLTDLEEAETSITSGQTHLTGTLKITAPLSFGMLHLKPLINDFLQKHSDLDLEIDFNDRKVDLIDEGFDVAVRIGVLENSSLIARKLAPIRQAVAASPQFWKEHGYPKTPQDLEHLPCLNYSNHANPKSIHYWGPKGDSGQISPPMRLLVSNGSFLCDLSAKDLGFVVTPSFFLHDYVRDGRLEAVLTDYTWSHMHLYALYPPTRHLSNRVRAFIDLLVAHFASREKPYWDEMIF